MNIFTSDELAKTAEMFSKLVVRPEKKREAERAASLAREHTPTLMQAAHITRVPWGLIAALQHMEANGRLDRHIANGDPLTDRTVHEPVGLPTTGEPPFDYLEVVEEELEELRRPADGVWSVEWALNAAERFNGLGYRKRKQTSPYVWAGTGFEMPGRYISDGVFDRNAMSKQVGVAAVLRAMMEAGLNPLREP